MAGFLDAKSAVDLVHQLGVYVHASPKRMAAFAQIRANKNPETSKGLLPLKDVVTRWNSKEAAIKRVLRLRATVESFTTRDTREKCPRFDKKVFVALERIQPTLISAAYTGVFGSGSELIPYHPGSHQHHRPDGGDSQTSFGER